MNDAPNQEVVNDAAKLIMHRLVARLLARDPSLLERAKVSQANIARRFPARSFVCDWDDLLNRPIPELRSLLTSRSPDMNRLRLSSPFVMADGVDFTNPMTRRSIWSAARRLVTGRGHRNRESEASSGLTAA